MMWTLLVLFLASALGSELPRSVEERACPKGSSLQATFSTGRLESRPGLTCYVEDHGPVRVYFSVESTVRRDAWGTYPRMVRQLIVTWVGPDGRYEVQFVTDPKADGRGITLFKRDGVELLAVRKRSGVHEVVNRYLWVHRDSGLVVPEADNTWEEPPDAEIRQIVRRLRRAGYRAHRQLEAWIVDQEPAPSSGADPQVLELEDVTWLARRIRTLERPNG